MIRRSLWVVVGLMLAAASPVSLSGQARVVDGDTFTLGSERVRMGGVDAPEGRRVALVARGGTPLPELELDGEIVFVLGAERDGLPKELLERCDVLASIPQTGEVESLNVAMAGTVALYELARRV